MIEENFSGVHERFKRAIQRQGILQVVALMERTGVTLEALTDHLTDEPEEPLNVQVKERREAQEKRDVALDNVRKAQQARKAKAAARREAKAEANNNVLNEEGNDEWQEDEASLAGTPDNLDSHQEEENEESAEEEESPTLNKRPQRPLRTKR